MIEIFFMIYVLILNKNSRTTELSPILASQKKLGSKYQ